MPTSQRLRPLALASALCLLPILAACETIQGALGERTDAPIAALTTDTACGSFQRITPSKRDTDGTLAQIHEHNAVFDVLCEGTTH